MSSVERSFYDRLHKQVISTQAQHQASQKKRRPAGSSRNPTRSVCPYSLWCTKAWWFLHHPEWPNFGCWYDSWDCVHLQTWFCCLAGVKSWVSTVSLCAQTHAIVRASWAGTTACGHKLTQTHGVLLWSCWPAIMPVHLCCHAQTVCNAHILWFNCDWPIVHGILWWWPAWIYTPAKAKALAHEAASCGSCDCKHMCLCMYRVTPSEQLHQPLTEWKKRKDYAFWRQF